MAKKEKSNALVPVEKAGGLVSWDEELAKLAAQAAESVAGIGGGTFFSLRGGQLSYGGQQLPGNTAAAVVLDFVNENVFYGSRFDPDNPTGPKCYAFGRDPQKMAPFDGVDDPVHANCKECPNNVWGSSDTGRGKACRNVMRLALIPAGTFHPERGEFDLFSSAKQFQDAGLAYLKLPVTSVKAWGTYVKQLAAVMKTPPLGVVTRIRVVPDPKTQFRLEFEPLTKIAPEAIPAVIERHKEAAAGIEFPYQMGESAPAAAPTAAPVAGVKGKGRRKF